VKIVMAANWWYRRGGLGSVMFDEAEWLTRRSHDVIPFASAHPANEVTPWAGYFPSFRETSGIGAGEPPHRRLKTAARLVHNVEAAERFDALVRDVKPDLVHLHNTVRQLSPSILGVARRHRVPVVMTLHDYGLVCPQGQLYKAERAACTPPNCVRGNVVHAVVNRCVKRSLAGSVLAATEHLIHRSLGLYVDRVDTFVTPSRFLRDRIAEARLSSVRVRVVVNGLPDAPPASPVPRSGGHVLFAGRLAREKGLDVLLEAARRTPQVRYTIAGDGPLRSVLAGRASANVRFVGHQGGDQLRELLDRAVASVVPSTWFENAPLTVLEAMRSGRPVIASRIGGHEEMLEHGGGTLVPVADVGGLASAVASLWTDRDAATRLGAEAREVFVRKYRIDTHMERLLTVYAEALGG